MTENNRLKMLENKLVRKIHKNIMVKKYGRRSFITRF
jgi:hypothetical protein